MKASLESRAPLAPLEKRSVVFISHANPEDNAQTAWYGARLTAAGYEVWTDLTRLLGGEEMWRDIDDALRFSVRKLVVLVSRAVTLEAKEGLRAEIERAQAIRRKLGDSRFIIPVRIDDVPHDELPPTLASRTVIDARENPAEGLARIQKILEKDQVARQATPSSDVLARWQGVISSHSANPEKRDEVLVTDWYRIVRLPEVLRAYTIERPLANAVTEPMQIARSHPLPVVAHMRRLLSFAPWDAIQGPIADVTPLKLDQEVPLAEFLAGDTALGLRHEAGKHLASLLRQAFDQMARTRGLSSLALSESKTAWWVPDELVQDNKVYFKRASGTEGWRKLVGEYGARKRQWHYGVAAKPILSGPQVIKLTGHVIYTDPLGEQEPTAKYRRAHCRMWFNAEWRDRLYAFVASISDAHGQIKLPFGGDSYGLLSGEPMALVHHAGVPLSLEQRAASEPGGEGDSPTLDISEREGDPTFAEMDQEIDEVTQEADDEVEQDEFPDQSADR